MSLGLKFRGKEVHSESIEDNTVNEHRHFLWKVSIAKFLRNTIGPVKLVKVTMLL